MLLARCCGTYYISSKRRLTAPYSVGALPVQAEFCGKLRFFCGGGRRGIHSVEADRLPAFAAAFVVEALKPHHPAQFRSEERRVGQACVSTSRSRWSPAP